jgi:hypothetical protein
MANPSSADDLMSDVVWVVVERSQERSDIFAGHVAANEPDKAVFTVKYEVSKADRQGLVDGVHKVYSNDETFKGLAGKLVAEALLACVQSFSCCRVYFAAYSISKTFRAVRNLTLVRWRHFLRPSGTTCQG